MGFEAAEPVLNVSLFIEEGTVWSRVGQWKLSSMSGHWELKTWGCQLGRIRMF